MTAILIIGESGTGKTTSTRNLDPKETFIIGVTNKQLPYKNIGYILQTKDTLGNLYYIPKIPKKTDDPGCQSKMLIETLNYINDKRKEIKTVVIDDFQYLMSNEFMYRSSEKGYEKFTDIGKHAFEVIETARSLRDDINVYIFSHSDTDITGKSKLKTIGKMLDDKICVEGLFTIVLHSMIVDGKYVFLTQNNGMSIAKSPMGMFDSLLIDNDIKYANETINKYYEQPIL